MNPPAPSLCRRLRSVIKASPVVLNDNYQSIASQTHSNLHLVGVSVPQDIINSLDNNPINSHLCQTWQLDFRDIVSSHEMIGRRPGGLAHLVEHGFNGRWQAEDIKGLRVQIIHHHSQIGHRFL